MDALVRELNGLGYQPVFLPGTGPQPPELYSYSQSQRRLVRRGPLADYLPKTADVPVIEADLANIDYQYTSGKNVSATASFLQNSLKCIGIDALPKLDLGFAGSNDFSFAFTGVKSRRVDPSKIDTLISGLNVGAIPTDIVQAGRIHIVYEYAYANELVMSRNDRREFKSDVSGKIGEFIDIGTKGSVSLASKSTISFKGAEGQRAAFAYKAGYLSREDELSKWEFHPEEMHRGDEDAQAYIPARGVVLIAD
ncbi:MULTISPECIES: hypothetical protein [Mesorhizobium]|uniref:gasdermin n=1 Tax=Mesorhizobium TaxID=68287 RepID=UPI0007EC86BC|nr:MULTISPECIES: hypothetical protein [Mesorhizobium]PBB52968.1 hypothetical protein CK223_27110 [Mesorhizobium loti]QIA22498.1 hypothetical protein A9K68_012470 [Mesorhizobium sp. AA22]